ncbi:MAG: hypothetical protein KY455_00275 [Euryarchaeota archaeon]|nr:hypothetical protein [Euryarchaeota archaeon]
MLVDKWLYGEKKTGNELKEMKVKVPLEYHIKLHGLKLLSNQSISKSVETALQKYFAELEGPHTLEEAGVVAGPRIDRS